MTYAVPAPARTVLPVRGSEAVFPVGRIFCVGRNYAEHTREMGHDPDREPPFFFMKPATSIVAGGGDMPYPPGTADLHHEMELVAAIGTGGRDIAEADALGHVFGYAAGLDMTRRDLQGVAKQLGRPWEVGKAFDHAAPCSPVVMAREIGHPETGAVRLHVNGELRQDGDISEMIWSLPEVVAHISALFALMPGDLIMTGTPAGVAAVSPGDRLEGEVEGVGRIAVKVV